MRKNRFNMGGIDPDEIFLDSANLPNYDTHQFEGRIEKPIGRNTVLWLGILFVIIGLSYTAKVWALQIENGEELASKSENNRLRHSLIFADRGIIYDRNNIPLAWNVPSGEDGTHNIRKYAEEGFSNLLGYIKYPQKDNAGFYYEENFKGVTGIENYYNSIIKGENGLRIVETNALQEIESANIIRPPKNGESLNLTIDSRVQDKLYQYIKELTEETSFDGGSAVIMDVKTGEIISLVTYPEFNSNVMTDGSDTKYINDILKDSSNPFLNRAIAGQYTPGSTVKPFVALAALDQDLIDPKTVIISRGQIEVQSPYDPDVVTIFKDWKAHGGVNMTDALAVSSNVYFYSIGGGYKDIEGLGISKIEEYVRKFGFGEEIDRPIFKGTFGVVPNPEWKKKVFDGDAWRLGDTYFTAIGQYGFQVSPLQSVRAVAAIANGGTLLEPYVVQGEEKKVIREIDIDEKDFEVVREGMREAVFRGTSGILDYPDIEIAAKTGTAELGVTKQNVNSWVNGFFPYENPRYAFAIVMEKGDRSLPLGAVTVAGKFFNWLRFEAEEYYK